MTDRSTPPTRRDLRVAERAARRTPWQRPPAIGPAVRGRHAEARRDAEPRARAAFLAPVAQVAVCAVLVVGGVGHVQVLRSEHAAEAARVAAAVAAQHELDRRERVDHASSARLTAAAAAYAAHQLGQALSVAQTAVDNAGDVVATATPVVSAEQLSPLGAALTELTAIIESSPLPAEVAAPVLAPAATADPDPATAAPSSRGAEPATRGDAPAATTAPPPATPPPAGTAPSVDAGAPGADEPAAHTAATRTPAPTPTSGATAPAVTDAPAPSGDTSDAGPSGLAPRPLDATADLSTLGLEVSARLIAAAQTVAALASEVKATADANIAAAQAEAAAAAAAQAARDRLAEQVAVADRSPNGAIPRDSLCGVGFAADVLLRCDAAAALEQLNVAYQARFGTSMDVVSTYRDLAGQAAARAQRGALAAVPGTSNHGRGLAVDIARTGSVGQFDAPVYLWLTAHAGEYGWHHPDYMEPGGSGPFEPWHWEFGTTSAD